MLKLAAQGASEQITSELGELRSQIQTLSSEVCRLSSVLESRKPAKGRKLS